MSITFSGRRGDGSMIRLALDHPAHLNLANGNAVAVLALLGLGDSLLGEVTIPEARRASIRARATFDRRVVGLTRDAADLRRPGHARVIVGGIDDEYLRRRLDDFERFVLIVAELGAVSVYWG